MEQAKDASLDDLDEALATLEVKLEGSSIPNVLVSSDDVACPNPTPIHQQPLLQPSYKAELWFTRSRDIVVVAPLQRKDLAA